MSWYFSNKGMEVSNITYHGIVSNKGMEFSNITCHGIVCLKLLTSDNPPLSNEQNESIFKHVFEYIKRSERFLVVYVFHRRKK
jgi:hypothetical protein